MQLADHFHTLLTNKVNISATKLTLLDSRVNAVYAALQGDDEIGPLIKGKTPQGSWAHRTIINPVGDNEFDADFMLDMAENPDWVDDPKKYINEVYAALGRHTTYGSMPRTRKCRCVRVSYANSMHLDIVPHLKLANGREVIVNRDVNDWEDTHPQRFTDWMQNKDRLANGNLRKVIRLMKYLRDHKGSFTGTRSILLTTMLGERVTEARKLVKPGCYDNVPKTLLNVVSDLDAWLQARPMKPSIPDPSGSGVTFDHRWEQSTYNYFRDRINAHAQQIQAAYDEPEKERSVRMWQELFGDGFTAPSDTSKPPKFSEVTPAAATTTVGRSGRAG